MSFSLYCALNNNPFSTIICLNQFPFLFRILLKRILFPLLLLKFVFPYSSNPFYSLHSSSYPHFKSLNIFPVSPLHSPYSSTTHTTVYYTLLLSTLLSNNKKGIDCYKERSIFFIKDMKLIFCIKMTWQNYIKLFTPETDICETLKVATLPRILN